MKTYFLRQLFFLVTAALAVACNVHEQGQVSDNDFKALWDKYGVLAQAYPDSALTILNKLLPQQQGNDKAATRARMLDIIGVSYDSKGKYDSAAHYLYEASRLAEKIEYDSLQMVVLSHLGILQFEMKNADEAVKYYQQSLAIAEKLKDSILIAYQLNNIGNAYMTLNNEFEKAIPYFEQCMEISEKINCTNAYDVAGINLAQIYNELGEHDKALQEIKRINDLYGVNPYATFTVGEIYYKKGNYEKAINEWKGILNEYEQLDNKEFECAILNKIADAYKVSGNSDSSLVYLEKLYAAKDVLHNLETDNTINKLKIAYETEKKEQKITYLEERQRFTVWLSLSAVVILLLALVAFFFLWRWTVQKRQLAESRIQQLEQEKQLIAAQSLLDGENRERSRLSRDLHDGLGSILAGAKINLLEMKKAATLDTGSLERYDLALSLLDKSMSEMRRIAHHLMPDTLAAVGLKQSIADFVASIPNATFSYYGDESRFDSKLEETVYRITHELVTNALKHSGASQILVDIVRYDNHVTLAVQDDGCGFDPDAVSANGMGMNNIRTRIDAFNGNLTIVSKQGVGTEVNVEFVIRVL